MISLETPLRKRASSCLEGRTSWIFSSCRRCSRLVTGTSGTRSGGLRKGKSSCELLGGLSGYLSRRCRDLSPCVETVPETEDSSRVLTWILGYFWSLPRRVSPRLEWGHARAPSSRAVAAVSRWLKTLCGVGAGTLEFLPSANMDLGVLLSLPKGVSPRLEWGPARALSSRAVAAMSRFPSLRSSDLWLSLEAFPRGFPTRLFHRAVPRATLV